MRLHWLIGGGRNRRLSHRYGARKQSEGINGQARWGHLDRPLGSWFGHRDRGHFLRRHRSDCRRCTRSLGRCQTCQLLSLRGGEFLVSLPGRCFLGALELFGLEKIEPGLGALLLTERYPFGHAGVNLVLICGGQFRVARGNGYPLALLGIPQGRPLRGQGLKRGLLGGSELMPSGI